MTDEELKRLDDLLETDLTLEKIARELGYSYHSFRLALANSGQAIKRRRIDIFAERQAREAKQSAQQTSGAVPV